MKKETQINSPVLLEAVDNFLQSENISPKDVQGIAVVVGSGTFSSVRAAVTLANAWHFALDIPVLAISPEEISVFDTLAEKLASKQEGYILPTYSAQPNIGIPLLK